MSERGAYYNEIDPRAAAWLRELIKHGHIAPGDVDERSIEVVIGDDLRGYTQCHFFAGIGVWSYALRRAGWDDARPVWTGSCPCQPFSASGKQAGFDDQRHLWPHLFRLIAERGPSAVFGEQVASPLGRKWLDVVCADLEGAGYAVGKANLAAAGVGAPHIRQRLYWVADAVRAGRGGRWSGETRAEPGTLERSAGLRTARGMADRDRPRLEGRRECGDSADERASGTNLLAGGMGDARSERGGRDAGAVSRAQGEGSSEWGGARRLADVVVPPGAVDGFWADAEWLACTDGKARPVEPGSFPLAHGAPARVGRLRGYGNAIVAQVATAFIEAYTEARAG